MWGNLYYLCGAIPIFSVGQSVLSLWGIQYYLCISMGQSALSLYLCGAISIIFVSLWGNQHYLCISVGQSVLSLWNSQYYLCGAISIISVGQSVLSLCSNPYFLCGAISIIFVSLRGNQYHAIVVAHIMTLLQTRAGWYP